MNEIERIIRQVRRSLTEIEMECETRHPEKPDFQNMRNHRSIILDCLDEIKRRINDVEDSFSKRAE